MYIYIDPRPIFLIPYFLDSACPLADKDSPLEHISAWSCQRKMKVSSKKNKGKFVPDGQSPHRGIFMAHYGITESLVQAWYHYLKENDNTVYTNVGRYCIIVKKLFYLRFFRHSALSEKTIFCVLCIIVGF